VPSPRLAGPAGLVVEYLRERYDPRLFVPLAAVLVVSGAVAAGGLTGGVPGAARSWLLAWVLVLVFRLWDDLADRPRDGVQHPHRVLARCGRSAPFLALLGVLAVVALALLLASPGGTVKVLVLLAVAAALAAWYRGRAALGEPAVLGAHLVLGKYPAIAYAAVPAVPGRELTPTPLVILYLALCVYEALHDRRVRTAAAGRASLAADGVLLCGALLYALMVDVR
jgi:4-hydroxybenzoate polyprenyltransferase